MKTGIHTPETSTKFHQEINERTGINFTDCSYGNDCCDSIWNEEKHIVVYLPNSEEDDGDEECFVGFAVRIGEEGALIDLDNTSQVSEFIKYKI